MDSINLFFIHCKYFQQAIYYLHNGYIYDYIVYYIMVLERCGGGVPGHGDNHST